MLLTNKTTRSTVGQLMPRLAPVKAERTERTCPSHFYVTITCLWTRAPAGKWRRLNLDSWSAKLKQCNEKKSSRKDLLTKLVERSFSNQPQNSRKRSACFPLKALGHILNLLCKLSLCHRRALPATPLLQPLLQARLLRDQVRRSHTTRPMLRGMEMPGSLCPLARNMQTCGSTHFGRSGTRWIGVMVTVSTEIPS